MNHNFCTLFNSNYLSRGLAMYESLKRHSGSFHLFIFSFDDKTNEILYSLNLENVTIIPLHEFEDDQLLEVKPARTPSEYCWTCTPSTILYVVNKYDVESCTYLDADLYFFANPEILIDEMEEKSVLITEHRYSPQYDQSKVSGIYCVQFITFKNTVDGLRVLNWWRNACLNWCFARHEDGKFGDQKYLDNWTADFKGVHVLKNLGGGVAPWNIQQYDFYIENNILKGKQKNNLVNFNVVFYHFHELKIYQNNNIDLCGYLLENKSIGLIYKPYIIELLKQADIILKKNSKINCNGIVIPKKGLKQFYGKLKRKFNKTYNVYKAIEIVNYGGIN